MDDEVLKIETRLGKQAQTHRRDFHLPSQSQTDGIGDPSAQPVRSGPYQKQRQEHENDQREDPPP